MWEYIYKYLVVFGLSMIKFLLGMGAGIAFGLPFWVTAILNVLGMMASIILFTSVIGRYFHNWVLKVFYKDRKLFTKSNRRKIIIWNKFGLLGVALLTPILFTPIGGAMIVNAFGESKERIYSYMFGSCVIWAFGFSFIVNLVKTYLSFLWT
jgi:hypothetical protein